MWTEYLSVDLFSGFLTGMIFAFLLFRLWKSNKRVPKRIMEGYSSRRLLLGHTDSEWILNKMLGETYLGIVNKRYSTDDVPVEIHIYIEDEVFNANT